MKKLLIVVVLVVVIVNIILSSWRILDSDILFSSDIARDFHLLNELDQKKIVLIGPRSSTGLFHGPLWLYLNYPAFLLGGGNPVVVGWYWIFLSVVFVIANFFIAKKLFGEGTAFLFTLTTSLYMSFHAYGLFNPHGAMFLLPSFFYFFVKYLESKRPVFLAIHIVITALLIQFQMAVGMPFAILSFLAISWIGMRTKRILHIFLYLLLPLLLINFIVFDIRHDFILSNLVRGFLTPQGNGATFNYFTYLSERIRLMLSSPEILRADPGGRNLALFLALLVCICLQVKDGRYRRVYVSFLFFYVGFFVFSFINKGPLLYFYLFPLFPLVFLMVSSLITSRINRIFLIAFIVIFIMNFRTALSDITYARDHLIGKDEDSWKFLYTLAKNLYDSAEDGFGYFIFSPDAFGYEPKYAMFFTGKRSAKSSYYFQKKPITYIVAAPPPMDDPYMTHDWWRRNQINISGEPIDMQKYDNGYVVEKYILSDEETKVPFDPSIDPGLHFR